MFDLKLTPKQQEAVDYSGDEMLVKGIAGSGKTTVLLKRARKIITTDSQATVALFTYNKTLRKYATSLARILESDRIKVYNFHSWARQLLDEYKVKLYVVKGKNQDAILEKAIKNIAEKSTNRLVNENKYFNFLKEEISFIKGKDISQRDGYLNGDRSGRGSKVRLVVADREVVFDVFQRYCLLLKEQKKCDFDDFALLLKKKWEESTQTGRYDHVFVDEAQDLHYLQLILLKQAARKGIVFAADKGQKIYNTSFSWREIGINVSGGRTKVLTQTHRSTKQIISLAHSLQRHDPGYKNKDEDYVSPEIPNIEGPIPQLIVCKNAMVEYDTVFDLVKKIQESRPNYVIGLLGRGWKDVQKLKFALETRGMRPELIQEDEGDVLSPGVKISNFHSVKGLEFDSVIICKFRDDAVPKKENHNEKIEVMEEHLSVERRLLYVAMTRAKFELYLVQSGGASSFLKELDSDLYEVRKV